MPRHPLVISAVGAVRPRSQQFSVYLWDMPGYGESSKQPEHAVDLGTQSEVIDGAGHLIQHDAPVELAAALQRWLTASGD